MKRARTDDHRTRVGQARSARTETRILAAALGVFAARGPDAPVIDEFVEAAGISRGTFYNHFKSVEELLLATSEWTTREVVQAIEAAMADLDGPTLRLGVGLRTFLARAQREPVWARFVAQVWKVGGLELPLRDLDDGIRRKHFRVVDRTAARDVVLGGLRQALHRIGTERVPAAFGDQVAAICLQALGADATRIAAAAAHALPSVDVGRPPDEDARAHDSASRGAAGANRARRRPAVRTR